MAQESIYRKIVRKTWRRSRFQNLPSEIKLFLMYLWTGPDAATPGLYYISKPVISDDLGIGIRTVSERLRYCMDNGWIKYDEDTRFIFFPRWDRYDPPPNENTVKYYKRYALDAPDCRVKTLFLNTLRPYMERFGIPYPNGSETVPEPFPNDSRLLEQEQRTRAENKSREQESPQTPQGDLCAEIIADLNQKTGKAFKPNSDGTRTAIEARLKEGWIIDDFQYVHDIKVAEWKGTDMEKFLRPSTLYRPGNFENYRNQQAVDRTISETTRHNVAVLTDWVKKHAEDPDDQG